MTAKQLRDRWFLDIRPLLSPLLDGTPDEDECLAIMAGNARRGGHSAPVAECLHVCVHISAVATAVFCGYPPSEQLPSGLPHHAACMAYMARLVAAEIDTAMDDCELESYAARAIDLQALLEQVCYGGYAAVANVWRAAFGECV